MRQSCKGCLSARGGAGLPEPVYGCADVYDSSMYSVVCVCFRRAVDVFPLTCSRRNACGFVFRFCLVLVWAASVASSSAWISRGWWDSGGSCGFFWESGRLLRLLATRSLRFEYVQAVPAARTARLLLFLCLVLLAARPSPRAWRADGVPRCADFEPAALRARHCQRMLRQLRRGCARSWGAARAALPR